MAGLTFKVNTLGLKNLPQELAKSATQTEHVIAVQAARDTEQYVPARTLSMTNRTRVIKNTIVYQGPYARPLWYGKKMVDAETGKGPMHYVDKKGNEVIRYRKGAKLKPTNIPLKISTAVHKFAQAFWFNASKAANIQKWLEVAAKAVTRFGK